MIGSSSDGTISDWGELNAGARCVRDVPAGG